MKNEVSKEVKRVLIVDDHPVFREGLAQLLEQADDIHVCGKVEDATEAMEFVDKEMPDLAILDISLSGKNGIELLKSLKAVHPELRVIMFSMHDEMLYAERALRAGAQGYLMKGEPVEHVIEAIHKVLAGELYLSKNLNASLIQTSIGKQHRGGEVSPVSRLSDRQLEVLELYGRGNSSRSIANKLKLSVKTVEVHRQNIKQKLGLSNAMEFTRFAVRWVDQN